LTQGIPQGRFPDEFKDHYSTKTLKLTRLVQSVSSRGHDFVKVGQRIRVRKRDAWQVNNKNFAQGRVLQIAEYQFYQNESATDDLPIYIAKIDLGAVIFNVHVSSYTLARA
jgi:hypothetical protein